MLTLREKDIDIKRLSELSLREQLLSFPEQAEYAMDVDFGDVPKAEKVCIFALGESAIAGDIISAYADDYSPIAAPTISDGRIPAWVDSRTSAIIVTYSGDNDVINRTYRILHGRRCNLYVISSGDYLKKVCDKNKDTFLEVPSGLSPRSATGFEMGYLAALIQKMGVCNTYDRLKELLPSMMKYRDSLSDDGRIVKLEAKLCENTIAVYGSPDVRASFKRWKMALNTDMGFPAYCGELPEFNHNEIVGWANHNQNADDLRIVVLRGEYKSEVLTKIIDKMVEVLEESNRHVIEIRLNGSDPMEKNLRGILLGDYISQNMLSASICPDSGRWVP